MSVFAAAMVGDVILGEYGLEKLAWHDDALTAFEARSRVDGGLYTVLMVSQLEVLSSAMSLQQTVDQAARRAMGLRTLRPLWKAAALSIEGHARLGVVRRGEAGQTLRALVTERPRSLPESLALLAPVVTALASLHDQGAVHGAVSPGLVTLCAEGLLLDGLGLSDVAEVAHGSGGTSLVIPDAYKPPELRGATAAAPGMWSDSFGFGALLLDLLTGRNGAVAALGEAPSVASLGLGLPARAELLIDKLISPSMAARSVDLRACFRALQQAASEPEAPAVVPTSSQPSWQMPEGGPTLPAPEAPAPARAEPSMQQAPLPLPHEASRSESHQVEPAEDARLRKLILVGGAALLVVMAASLGAASFFILRAKSGPAPSASVTASASAAPPEEQVEGEEAEAETEVVPSDPPAYEGSPSDMAEPSNVLRISTTPTYPEDAQALVPVLPVDAVWGDRDALLTLVIFGDLTCPYTARVLKQLPDISARYSNEVRFVFKLMPIAERPGARAAAEGAALVMAKGKLGAFWDFADDVFSARSRVDIPLFEEFGVAAGLKAGEMTSALSSRSMKARVEQDVSLGLQLGVRGTPVTFYNGRMVSGLQPIEQLFVLFDAELRASRAALSAKKSKPMTRAELYASRVLANITTAEGDRAPGDK